MKFKFYKDLSNFFFLDSILHSFVLSFSSRFFLLSLSLPSNQAYCENYWSKENLQSEKIEKKIEHRKYPILKKMAERAKNLVNEENDGKNATFMAKFWVKGLKSKIQIFWILMIRGL